jgi:hypothetical protein
LRGFAEKRVGVGFINLGEGFDLHVAVLGLPFVVLLDSAAPISRVIEASFGKIPTTSARRFTSLFSRSNGLVTGMTWAAPS